MEPSRITITLTKKIPFTNMLSTALAFGLFAAIRAAPLLPNPSGGIFNDKPTYAYQSDFDYAVFNLALNVEHAEYDLYGYGLSKFSVADFEAQGYTAADRWVELVDFPRTFQVANVTLGNTGS